MHLVGYFHNYITMHGFMNIKSIIYSTVSSAVVSTHNSSINSYIYILYPRRDIIISSQLNFFDWSYRQNAMKQSRPKHRTFLVAFVKQQRAIISFVMSVCLFIRFFVRMEQLCSYWTDFHDILYLCIFRKYVEKMWEFHKHLQE